MKNEIDKVLSDILSHVDNDSHIFNDLTYPAAQAQSIFEEGLIVSYPADKFKEALVNIIGHKIDSISIMNNPYTQNNKLGSIVIQWSEELTKREIENVSQQKPATFGYQLNQKEPNFNKQGLVAFEPKFPIEVSAILEKTPMRCFHISNRKKREKIQKIGLAPKESSTAFNFDGRIYGVFTEREPQSISQEIAQMLATQKEMKEYDVWEIDTSGLKYYHDDFATSAKSRSLSVFFTKNISKDKLRLLGGGSI